MMHCGDGKKKRDPGIGALDELIELLTGDIAGEMKPQGKDKSMTIIAMGGKPPEGIGHEEMDRDLDGESEDYAPKKKKNILDQLFG